MKNATRTLIATAAAAIIGVTIPQVTTVEAQAALPTPAATVDTEIAEAVTEVATETHDHEIVAPIEVTTDAPGIYGASEETEEAIEQAIARFNTEGLTLPTDLRIYVHDTRDECQGHPGLFNQDYSGTRIDLCTTDGFIVLHELAHAWEHHSMDDTTRQAFLDHTGLEVWNHADADWTERGIELAANAIAWGLLDETLTDGEATEYSEQLDRFELLTGQASPRHDGETTTQTVEVPEGSAELAAGYAQMAALAGGK